MALLPGFTVETPKQSKLGNLQREAEAFAVESRRANSFGGLARETGRGVLDFGKSVFGGVAGAVITPIQAGVSAATGRAPATLPALRLPVIGPVQVETAQRAAVRYVTEGDSVLKASAKGFGNFLLNEPLAIGPKLALTGVAISAKTLSKIVPELSRARSVQQVVDILYRRAPEIPPQTVETLAPHLAATRNTGEITKLLKFDEMLPPKGVRIASDDMRPLPVRQSVPVEDLSPGARAVTPEIRRPVDELPVIQVGASARAASELTTIRTDTPSSRGGLTYEPIPQTAPAPVKQPVVQQTAETPRSISEAPVRATTSQPSPAKVEPVKATTVETPQVPKTEIPKGTSKVGASVEAKAIEKRLTEGFEGTAGYDAITVKDQARRVDELIKNNIAGARRIVRGESPLPAEIRGSALITGLEEEALKRGNAEMLRELANSPLASATSRSAQELRLLAERIPDSPVAIIQDITKTRLAAAERRVIGGTKKATASTVKAIKGEIEKVAKKETWDSFVSTITC